MSLGRDVSLKKSLSLWTLNPESIPKRLRRAAEVMRSRYDGQPGMREWAEVAAALEDAAADVDRRLAGVERGAGAPRYTPPPLAAPPTSPSA